MNAKINLAAGAAVIALACLPQAGAAQVSGTGQPAASPAATPAELEASGMQDIVVTAQRRSERLQDVPVSVSAVTGATLTANGITGLQALTVAVPSLSTQSAGGYLTFRLRGVGSTANGPGFENPVALYIDGVYYANQTIGLANFNNVARIEVLKGPQGTLFGRNATGGLVQILTKTPGETPEFNGSVSYGNYDKVEVDAYASGPLTSDLAADLAVHFGRNDGYGTNLTNGRDVYATKYDVAARSKLVWTPGDLKFTLIADYAKRRNSDVALTGNPGSLTLPGVPVIDYPKAWDVNTETQPLLRIRGGGVSLKAETDLGDITVSNLAAYRASKFDDGFDYDGSPLPLASVRIVQKDWQVSDELQFISNGGDDFTWVAGAYYFRARARLDPSSVFFASDPALNPNFPVGTLLFNGYQDTESVSGYAQGTYKLTDTLNVTGGARYTYEKRKLASRIDGALLLPGSPVVPIVPTVNNDSSFKRPTFRASLDFKPVDDVLLYASVNTGFKSGGFNVSVPTDPAYRPEKLIAYEIGEKVDLFDRRVRLNSALFYYDYKDIQIQLAQAAGTRIINGARAKLYGLDSELTVFPVRALQITAGVTLLHAQFKNFPAVAIGVPGGGRPVSIGSATGNDLPYAPDVTFNLGGTYTLPIGDDELVANATWLHSSSYFHEADNVVRQPAYDQFNASLTYTIADGRYAIAAFGNNLSNAKVQTTLLTIPSGQQIQALQPPRTYGVRLSFKY